MQWKLAALFASGVLTDIFFCGSVFCTAHRNLLGMCILSSVWPYLSALSGAIVIDEPTWRRRLLLISANALGNAVGVLAAFWWF